MIYQRLSVFVSSKMQELAAERQAIKVALDVMKVDAWVFEQDAGARPESIEKAFLDEIETADLYLGLFWKGYGEYTVQEYEHARKLGKDCLIYEKRSSLGVERDPRLQSFLNQLSDVKTGLTIRWFDSPDELSELVKDDIAKWQKRKIDEREKPRINFNLSLAEKRERDDQLILLRKVKLFWVEGVLQNSVHGQALIDLGKEEWAETKDHPWKQILELPDQTSRTLPAGQPIGTIFDDVGRSLLILGAPGSGKTITLLDLARELIARAEADPSRPIPVVFNLSTWTDPKQNILEWLVEETLAKYQVPRESCQRWLKANWLLPLLDGLDEVMPANRSLCLGAINSYVQNHGAPGLVVCSRLKEYLDLPARLRVTGVIRLQPLTSEQVKTFVAFSGNSLTGLSKALEKDRVLQALAETPLMLDVMSLAYRDIPAEALVTKGLDTEEKRRNHLFDTYIRKMFIRKGQDPDAYTSKQTCGWLSWMACGMQQQSQTVFMIEQLQPSWLGTRKARVLYTLVSRLIFGLIFGLCAELTYEPADLVVGLIYGSIGGMVFGLIDEFRFQKGMLWKVIEMTPPRCETIITIVVFGLVFALLYGVIRGLIYGLLFGLTAGLFCGLRSRHRSATNDIQCVETLRWSWRHAGKGLVIGLIYGFVGALLAGVIVGLANAFSSGLITGLIMGQGLAVLYVLIYAPFGALIGAFFGGLKSGVIEVKAIPNLGIALSIRNAVIAVALAFLTYGLTFGLSRAYFPDSILAGTNVPTRYGVILSLIAFLWYGGLDAIQHFTLRFILWHSGYTPFPYGRFLDYVTRLIFLQKVGGGYIFIHRLLLEHFAEMGKAETSLVFGSGNSVSRNRS